MADQQTPSTDLGSSMTRLLIDPRNFTEADVDAEIDRRLLALFDSTTPSTGTDGQP